MDKKRIAMNADRENIVRRTSRIETLVKRVMQLEGQANRLMESQTVEAEAFVMRDERAVTRARLGLRDHAPRLTFYDRTGKEQLYVGLHADGAPDVADLGS